MISNTRVQRLFAYLLPLMGGSARSKAELDRIYAEIERILGYDAKKAAALRRDTRERDGVVQALMRVSLSRQAERSAAAPRERLVEPASARV